MSKLVCGSLAFRSGLPWPGAGWFVGRGFAVAAALLVTGLVACSSPTSETAAGESEASTLGTAPIAMEEFEASSSNGSCSVTWRGTPALAVAQCKGGLVPQAVPIVVAGITYAVWATESCSAGGACAGMQFYAITTDGTRAWASPAFGQGYRLTRIMPRADGITLELEPAADSGATIYFELRMGGLRNDLPNAAPPPSDEPPKTVMFGDGCALVWKNQALMSRLECRSASTSPLRLERKLRSGHTNFYIYGTPSAGGGNACDGDTFFVVTATATEAWISEGLGGCAELGEASPTAEGITFKLDAAFGTVTCEAKPTSAKCAEPSAAAETEAPSSSRQTTTITGELTGGSHADNWMYSIAPATGGKSILIDNEGKCAIGAAFDSSVEIRLSCVTTDGESTICTCEQLRVLD